MGDVCICWQAFCQFDDYNWDWSLQFVGAKCMPNKLKAIIVKSPRVFHIGEWYYSLCTFSEILNLYPTLIFCSWSSSAIDGTSWCKFYFTTQLDFMFLDVLISYQIPVSEEACSIPCRRVPLFWSTWKWYIPERRDGVQWTGMRAATHWATHTTDFLPRHITTVARTGRRTEQASSDEGLW